MPRERAARRSVASRRGRSRPAGGRARTPRRRRTPPRSRSRGRPGANGIGERARRLRDARPSERGADRGDRAGDEREERPPPLGRLRRLAGPRRRGRPRRRRTSPGASAPAGVAGDAGVVDEEIAGRVLGDGARRAGHAALISEVAPRITRRPSGARLPLCLPCVRGRAVLVVIVAVVIAVLASPRSCRRRRGRTRRCGLRPAAVYFAGFQRLYWPGGNFTSAAGTRRTGATTQPPRCDRERYQTSSARTQ